MAPRTPRDTRAIAAVELASRRFQYRLAAATIAGMGLIFLCCFLAI
jgi:hypothetical protein